MTRFPLAATLVAAINLGGSALSEEKVPLPASPPLMQVLVSIDHSGRLAFRMNVPEYWPRMQPASEGGKEKQATTYEIVHREQTYQVDPTEVKAYDSRGKEIGAKDLPALLKRETLALYSSGEKLDPLQLRLVKDGTLIFTRNVPTAAGPGQGPGRPAATPVPGLAELLKRQGYVAVPVQRLPDSRLNVQVTVRGKELCLLVDTGAGRTSFDRHRVRHLGLEWKDDFCDIEGLEVGGLKAGPLLVDAFDLTAGNRWLRERNEPERDGLLGADVLRRLGAVIDHAGGVLYLAPGPTRAATPVPGLAELLKRQGYVAVPVQRDLDAKLSIQVTVRGKELRLLVDTGAGRTSFDRHRVRHLGLEWKDDFCDIEDLEIAGVKAGPLLVDTFDLTAGNRWLRERNEPEQDGLLGADVLRRLGAVIDHAGGVLYLRPKEGSK